MIQGGRGGGGVGGTELHLSQEFNFPTKTLYFYIEMSFLMDRINKGYV